VQPKWVKAVSASASALDLFGSLAFIIDPGLVSLSANLTEGPFLASSARGALYVGKARAPEKSDNERTTAGTENLMMNGRLVKRLLSCALLVVYIFSR